MRAASSSSVPTSSSTGTTSRITKGIAMKIVTSTIDGSANMIWMPRASKNDANQPPVPNSRNGHDADGHRRDGERAGR